MPYARPLRSPEDFGLDSLFRALDETIRAACKPYLPPRPRRIVGNVDLTDTDLTRPFLVDFSVPADASIEQKQDALARLKVAQEAFWEVFPRLLWLRSTLNSATGQYVLRADPIPQATSVAT